MKVGIIGCGGITGGHLPYVQSLEGIREVGLCDVDEATLREQAARYGVERTWTDVPSLLSELQPDVVHILTPPQNHLEHTLRAFEAGCHVLLEKPMALNVEEADAIIAAAQAKGRKLTLCHNLLFDPSIMKAQHLAASGALGRIVGMHQVNSVFHDKALQRHVESPWLYSLPGGFFHEILPHSVYLLRDFLGPLRVVSAVAKSTGGPLPAPHDELQVDFEGESGLASVLVSSTLRPATNSLSLYGTRMSVYVDYTNNTLTRLRVPVHDSLSRARRNLDRAMELVSQTALNTWQTLTRSRKLGHGVLIEKFYESIRHDTEPPVSAEEGRENVQVLDEVWEALGRQGE